MTRKNPIAIPMTAVALIATWMVLKTCHMIVFSLCLTNLLYFFADHLAEVVKKGPKLSKTSRNQESLSMVNPKVDKVLKNYMYDNPELKETNSKKECVKLDEDLESSSDNEIWLLQCPKNFDPQQMLCRELGKQTKMECSADKFTEKKTLVVIVPQKAAEYGLLCDSLQLVS